MAQFDLSITLEYDLVMEVNRLRLVEEVQKKIANGWQPIGGISFCEDYLCQAVVRKAPPPQWGMSGKLEQA